MNGVAGAWAVVDPSGHIMTRTISDARRAAIVNWLCTERSILTTQLAFDRQIEMMWEKLKGKYTVELITVARRSPQGSETP